jgi:hypothetical protein
MNSTIPLLLARPLSADPTRRINPEIVRGTTLAFPPTADLAAIREPLLSLQSSGLSRHCFSFNRWSHETEQRVGS